MVFLLLLLVFKQWGTLENQENGYNVILPISSLPIQAVANDISQDVDKGRNPLCLSTLGYSQGKFKVTGWRIYWRYGTNGTAKNNLIWAHWIAICK